jgi:hypothetical protein
MWKTGNFPVSLIGPFDARSFVLTLSFCLAGWGKSEVLDPVSFFFSMLASQPSHPLSSSGIFQNSSSTTISVSVPSTSTTESSSPYNSVQEQVPPHRASQIGKTNELHTISHPDPSLPPTSPFLHSSSSQGGDHDKDSHAPHKLLGQWTATAIAGIPLPAAFSPSALSPFSVSVTGNDILSSCLYTSGLCAAYAGTLLLFVALFDFPLRSFLSFSFPSSFLFSCR